MTVSNSAMGIPFPGGARGRAIALPSDTLGYPTVTQVAALIALASIAVLLARRFARASRRARLVMRLALAGLALASFAVACGDALHAVVDTPYGKTDAWGIFHYYLGAKYFAEVDYEHFYACVVAADRDRPRVWDADTRVRDLGSYAIVGRDQVAACPRDRFSPARWRDFVGDVADLQGLMPEAQRALVLTDKGFNPPPSWAVPASWVANRVPLDHVAAATAVFNLDLLFALLSLAAIAWGVNLETASLTAIVLFLYFGNFGRLTGNFLQYAWLPALVGALLAWQARRYGQSAFWWALATLAQTFPAALASVVALGWLRLSARRVADAGRDAYGRFLAHYAGWLAVGVAAASFSERGPGAWLDWSRKITAHGRYLVGEVFDIGLRNLLATLVSSGVARVHTYGGDYPNVVARLAAFRSYEWVWYVVTVAVMLYVLARLPDVAPRAVPALGFVMMYVWLDLGPYYYASLALLFVLFPPGESAGLAIHVVLLALIAYHALAMPVGYVTFDWPDHLVSELLIAGFMLVLLVVATRRRPPTPASRAEPVPAQGRRSHRRHDAPGRRGGRGALSFETMMSPQRTRAGTALERRIPGTGELIPAIGLGTWQVFDVAGDAGALAQARATLGAFLAGGGRVIDSSPMYGSAEAVTGRLAALLGTPAPLFVATKVWTSGREAGISQMEASMRKLRVARIDLMQVHNLVDVDTHLDTLRDWKATGRVRHIGITHYHAGAHIDLERCLERHPVDFLQVNYSLAEPDADHRLLRAAADRGVAVIVNRPFAAGAMFRAVRGRVVPAWAKEIGCASWAQVFLKWILSHPAVTCVIPATRDPAHVADNLAAAAGPLPDASMRGQIARALAAP
jgi:diketogulonate reductase-like aldo/keto reductase